MSAGSTAIWSAFALTRSEDDMHIRVFVCPEKSVNIWLVRERVFIYVHKGCGKRCIMMRPFSHSFRKRYVVMNVYFIEENHTTASTSSRNNKESLFLLFMYIPVQSVCKCVSVYVCVCVCICVYEIYIQTWNMNHFLEIYTSVSLSLSLCLSIYLSLCLPASLSLSLFFCLSLPGIGKE